jgi:hypothetical protein
MTPFCKLAAANLKEASLTLREKVEKMLVLVKTSGCAIGGGNAGRGKAESF